MDSNCKIKNINNITNQFKDINQMKKLLLANKEFNEDFELIKYINSGSCGIVYEGRLKKNKNKSNRVALKFILNKFLESKRKNKNNDKIQDINSKLLKELKLQSKIKHKNITNLYGVCNLNNQGICMILEYAKYGDLENFQKKLLKKKTLSETLLVYLAKQILTGLNYCHQNDIIHMDIKQQNILITENLQIKISDFSVSLCYNNNKKEVELPLSGTSLFMSPEVLEKQIIPIYQCNKIDIFSFGILLYHLAFDGYPYGLQFEDRKNFNDISKKIKERRLDIPNKGKFSNLFKKFLSKLLEKKISLRYSITEALKDDWIKGGDYVFMEKEKIVDLEKFILNIISDSVKSFNDYLKLHDNNYNYNYNKQ